MGRRLNCTVHTAFLGLAILALPLARMSLAAPVHSKVLEEVAIHQHNNETPVLEVRLSFLFSYLGHFPLNEGKELRIRLKPVQVAPSDRKSVFGREGLRPLDGNRFAVDEVIYEGDVKEGPWLTVRFTRSLRYRVVPDPNYRNIRIFLDTSN